MRRLLSLFILMLTFTMVSATNIDWTLLTEYIPLNISPKLALETPYLRSPKMATMLDENGNTLTYISGDFYLSKQAYKHHITTQTAPMRAFVGKDGVIDSIVLDIAVTPKNCNITDSLITDYLSQFYGEPINDCGIPMFEWEIETIHPTYILTEILYKTNEHGEDDIPYCLRLTYLYNKYDEN